MTEMIQEIPQAGGKEQPVEVRLATVAEVLSNGLRLTFDGSSEPTSKIYKCNAACIFSVGDRVKVTKHSGTYLVDYVIGVPASGGIKELTNGSYSVRLAANGQLVPNARIGLGTASSPFGFLYTTASAVIASNSDASITLGSSSGSIGFFGHTPAAKQTVANNATVAQLITALKAYGLIE